MSGWADGAESVFPEDGAESRCSNGFEASFAATAGRVYKRMILETYLNSSAGVFEVAKMSSVLLDRVVCVQKHCQDSHTAMRVGPTLPCQRSARISLI